MDAAIKTTELTKFYGNTRGVEALDLETRAGEVRAPRRRGLNQK